MTLDRNAYYVLGMLRAGAREPYEVKLGAEFYTHSFWTVDTTTIDATLVELERAGLVERVAQDAGRWPPTSHSVTPAGERALREALTSAEPDLELGHGGLLRVLLADDLEPGERRSLLTRLRAGHELERDRLDRVRPELERACEQSGDRFPLIALDLAAELQQFFIDRCSRLEQALGR